MKHLPKHLQPRWRYLAVVIETWPETGLGRGEFQRQLWYAAQNLLGDATTADLDLTVLRFEHDDRCGCGHAVVRARRGTVESARAAVACLDEINGDPIGVRVRGVSGTIRACEEKYIRPEPESPEERTVAFEDADRAAVVRSDRYDVRLPSAFAGATALDFE